MPRIPVRVEPYTSPSRQHRHFKNKRDQVLRALGKAAYINGSHFAIMWVSARGDVETYASEALQNRLDDWFIQSGIAEEGKSLVMGSKDAPRSNPFEQDGNGSNAGDDDASDQSDADDVEDPSPLRHQQSDMTDVFLDGPSSSMAAFQDRIDLRPTLGRSNTAASGSLSLKRKHVAPLDTAGANDAFVRSLNGGRDAFKLEVPHSAPLLSHEDGPQSSTPRLPLRTTSSRLPSSASSQALVNVRLENAAARTAFLELRFSQLQQGMCKTVAKAWIKIIEPKKQTRCPYNKGEEGKPTWWPEGVRHKEPDHLMKPERHLLLLTILRSPKIKVARLQLATAEVVALIRADRVSLLMDVYRIAREEERMREENLDMDTSITVGVSTSQGWNDDDQAVDSDAARSNSPGDDNDDGVPGARLIASKKRPLPSSVGLSRTASASAAFGTSRPVKRPTLATRTTLGPIENTIEAQRPHSAGNLGNNAYTSSQPWAMPDGTNLSYQKQQAAAASVAAAAAAASGYGAAPNSYQQVNGLITPVTAHSQLMDPSFLQAAQQHANAANAMVDGKDHQGYMSAPQLSHPQLYPHSPSAAQPFSGYEGSQDHHDRHGAAAAAAVANLNAGANNANIPKTQAVPFPGAAPVMHKAQEAFRHPSEAMFHQQNQHSLAHQGLQLAPNGHEHQTNAFGAWVNHS
ncbi:Protein of unknown function DUF2841 [Ceraceosorus bombacis]|uniref:Subtelomeric hrmA-associated cluster protein AFUB-079030/YDR124W-like helical bundle domain-containing protein n=1 Tax=Ceraceosorus bombacis TaxID=401625 RepID=A0A0P1BBP3_9BASI|nr:Protein of unknown function DUF2841 [Ceraceosorus bombacis]